ncbi:hypothetical protein E4U22_001820 [Claviceps purpurea]|nr:hypothetical protein E4U46_006428 [Claviceps purpurea]KAG6312430.1 hypothetical protein E4U22_001820 [Claviceps purpurea]
MVVTVPKMTANGQDNERNDGTLQNITLKFIALTLKKASGIMKRKSPQRNWKHDSTLRPQFNHIRDDWRIFKEIISSRTSVLEEAVANIFRDAPDAGRNIFETDDVVRLDFDLSDDAGDMVLSIGADNLSRDLNDPQSSATHPKKPTKMRLRRLRPQLQSRLVLTFGPGVKYLFVFEVSPIISDALEL